MTRAPTSDQPVPRASRAARALRIFISSPSDVAPERLRAALVIEKLQKDYSRFFRIGSVLWETEPMVATGHFQDIIDPPSTCDIVVLIMWSRLGVKLPARTATREYRGIDGRTPVTGTEWEFEEALAAARVKHAPDLLAYHKTADPVVSLRDEGKRAAAEEQWQMLDVFWKRHFFNAGEFITAHSDFKDLDAFEAKFESDLRRLIEKRIGALQASPGEALVVPFLKGNPFRGLEAYRVEHAAVFFGRAEATKVAVERLIANADAGRAFLMILGASGTGKSSLAQAGVVAALLRPGVVSGVGLWRWAVMRPAGHPDGPFAALAESLAAANALPEMLAPGQDPAALARHLAAAAEDPAYPFVAALGGLEREARAGGKLLTYEAARLVLVVDQMEELFTAAGTVAAGAAFVRCLEGLAKSGHVFVVATMRSDYWHRAADVALLAQLAADRGRLDLLPPTQAEMTEMIHRPAQAAGLAFETDARTEIGLDAALGEEAANAPGVLPLLAFLLDALYARDVEELGRTTLTYESMRRLGGLNGALQNRADAVFAGLPPEAQAAFPTVLSALVRVGIGDGEEQVAPRRAPRASLEGAPGALDLVAAFVDARLFVADAIEGKDGRPDAIVGVTHEALLRAWPRAAEWIKANMRHLRTRGRVTAAEALWRHADRAKANLLSGAALAQAQELVTEKLVTLSPEVAAFIAASGAHAGARRRGRRLRLAGFAATVLVLVAGGAWYYDGYVRTSVTLHPTQFVRRFGLLEPVLPALDREQSKHHHELYRMTRKGRYGPIVMMEIVNGHGVCPQNPSLQSWFGVLKQGPISSARECRVELGVEGGSVSREAALDRNGRLVWTFIYSAIDKSRATAEYYAPSGTYLPMSGSGASRLEFTRIMSGPQAGFDGTIRFMNDVGRPQPDDNGSYGFSIEYDDRRLPRAVRRLGPDGRVAMGSDGYAVERREFGPDGDAIAYTYEDENGGKALSVQLGATTLRAEYQDGNIVKTTLYDDHDRPIPGTQGWAVCTRTYNEFGDLIETSFFDAYGNPVTGTGGFARMTFKHDSQGKVIEDATFDANGDPIAVNGSPVHSYGYDRLGNQIIAMYLDADHSLMRTPAGYARMELAFDDHGFVVATSYFDEKGLPAPALGPKAVRTAMQRDDYGRVVSQTFYDADGLKTPGANGAVEVRHMYDDRGNQVSEAYFDEHGAPFAMPNGFTGVLEAYDDHGHIVRKDFVGPDKRPTASKAGWSSVVYANDSAGHALRIDYLDERGQPADKPSICATTVQTFDAQGHRTMFACRDEAGHPKKDTEGMATKRQTWDRYGRLLSEAYFDEADKPMNIRGYAEGHLAYDADGNIIDASFIDADGAPAHVLSGGCAHYAREFAKGKLVKSRCLDKPG